MSSTIRIVIIEDNENDLLVYERFIKKGIESELSIISFEMGEEALQYLTDHGADCVLLDYKLPDMTGLEILTALVHADTPAPPVVMLTGMGNENVAVQALKLGAYDYLSKSDLQEAVLIKAITNATEKSTLAKHIDDREKEISKMAEFDILTGLLNRSKFEEILQRVLEANPDSHVAVFMVDLDRFKDINDSKGHEYGDQLLKVVSRRLKKSLSMDIVLSRLGGDEFAVLAVLDDEDEATKLADLIASDFVNPFSIGGQHQESIKASIGIAMSPYAGDSSGELLKNADVALFTAKSAGRNTFRFFSEDMSDMLSERLQIEKELRSALAKQEFFLVYHPISNVQDGRIFALEVLVRWRNQQLGMVPPDKFIPIAEDMGLITEIGEWILDTALAQLSQWQSQFGPNLRFTINISPEQTKGGGWIHSFASKLKRLNINPHSIIIELTETAIVSDLMHTREVLSRFTDLGCSIFLDDFGTGYSSINLVRQLPISGLKIDKTYVQDLDKDKDDALLVESIFAFAEVLQLKVVAEGVEKDVQLDFLRKIAGHQLAQGFFLSLPLETNDMQELLSRSDIHKSD